MLTVYVSILMFLIQIICGRNQKKVVYNYHKYFVRRNILTLESPECIRLLGNFNSSLVSCKLEK